MDNAVSAAMNTLGESAVSKTAKSMKNLKNIAITCGSSTGKHLRLLSQPRGVFIDIHGSKLLTL
jgi:hypothetical protein